MESNSISTTERGDVSFTEETYMRRFESEGNLLEGIMQAADLFPSTSHAVHPSDAEEVPSDLNRCRNRIDASVQQQKKNRQVLAALSNKVSVYRQKAAETAAQLANSANAGGGTNVSTKQVMVSQVESAPTGDMRTRFAVPTSSSSLYKSSSIVKYDHQADASAEAIFEQLLEEQIRTINLEEINEMLRGRAEAAIHANAYLRQDLATASEQLKQLNDERTKLHRQNRRNSQLLSEQSEHIRVLWATCNSLKRQMKDFHTETENDLERQKTEFIRCANNMEHVIHQFQIKGQQMATTKVDSKEDEAFDNLLKDYEKIASRNMKLEQEQSEYVRKLTQADLSLRRVNDERETLRDSIKKIHQMPELVEARGRRARSISPVGYMSSFDTVRLIRMALQNRDDEARVMQRKFDELGDELSDLKQKLTKSDESRRSADAMVKDLKKELQEIKHEKERWEREGHRLNDKIERLDVEKLEANTTITQLREEISNLHRKYQTSMDELMDKQQSEIDRRRQEYNEWLDERERENIAKITKIRNNMETIGVDLEKTKEQLRNMTVNYNNEKQRADQTAISLEECRKACKEHLLEIDEGKRKNETQQIEIDDLEHQIEELKLNVNKFESTITKLKLDREALMAERSSLSEQLTTMRSELLQKNGLIERLQISQQDLTCKTDELTTRIETYEQTVSQAREHQLELESRLAAADEHNCAIEAEHLSDKEKIEKYLYEMEIMKEEKIRITAEYENLKQQLDESVQSFSEMKKKITILEESHRSERRDNKEKLDELKNVEKKLKSALEEANHQIEVKSMEMDKTLKKERETFKKEIEKLDQQYKQESLKSINELEQLLQRSRNDKNELEKNLAAKEQDLEQQSHDYKKLMDEYEKLKLEYANLKENSAKDKAELRMEFESLAQQHAVYIEEQEKRLREAQNIIDDKEREMRKQRIESEEMKEFYGNNERILQETIDAQQRDLAHEKNQLDILEKQFERYKERMEVEMESMNVNRQASDARVRAAETESRRLQADAEIAKAKYAEAEKSVAELQKRLNLKTKDNNVVETELNALKEALKEKETSIVSITNRFDDIKKEFDKMVMERNSLNATINERNMERTELYERIKVLEKEFNELAEQKVKEENEHKKQIAGMEQLQIERNNLRQLVKERSNQLVEQSTRLEKIGDEHMIIKEELEAQRQKNIEYKSSLQKQMTENECQQKELNQIRDLLNQKNDSNKIAMNNIIENYRSVERERSELLRQRDEIASELAALRERMKGSEGKYLEMEQKLKESEFIRNRIQQQVDHYEALARRALTSAQTQQQKPTSKPAAGATTAPTTATTTTTTTTRTQSGVSYVVRASTLSHKITSEQQAIGDRSGQKPKDIKKDHRSGSVGAGGDEVDAAASVDITFRYLRDRIEQLEREKADAYATIAHLRKDIATNDEQNREALQTIENLRKRIAELEQDKRSTESRLGNSRQMLVSQDELICAKDRELKSLKTRIVHYELHSKEKESKIYTLTDQIESLKAELSAMEEERKSWKESAALWEEERNRLEQLLKCAEEELQRCRNELNTLKNTKENLSIRLSERERASVTAERRCGELETAINDYRGALAQFQVRPKPSIVHAVRSSSVSTYRRTEIISRKRKEVSASASMKLYKEC